MNLKAKIEKLEQRLGDVSFISSDEKEALQILNSGISDEETLKRLLHLSIGVEIPDVAVCKGHTSPNNYLRDTILYPDGTDKVCWACRGGGKTMLGAIATWLDSLLIEGCQTKILGGSFEQSQKMYEYTLSFWKSIALRQKYLLAEPLVRTTKLKKGGAYTILTASQKSVRGPHVPRVKLDEIDEFDKSLYEAACYIAQTKDGIKACTELFSTMHRPYGLMAEIIDSCAERGYKLYKWCLFEVLERCTQPKDACNRCLLFEDCVTEDYPKGKARKSNGYYKIDDAKKLKQKVSKDSWEAEALCLRAKRSGLVYKDYWNEDIHVVADFDIPFDWKRFRALDFGVANPFVCLYIAQSPDDVFFVYDEIYQSGKTAGEWAEIIRKKELESREEFEFTTADPSGKDQIRTFCLHDVPTVACFSNDIEFGLEQVKRLLKVHPERKTPSLFVMSKCVNLRREFNAYHYPENKTGDRNRDEKPVKKEDHALDALRYLAVDISRHMTDIIDISL
jgi:hypothetical protein